MSYQRLTIPDGLTLFERLRWIECCREALRREHNRRSTADEAAWRVWLVETFLPRNSAISDAIINWRAERAWDGGQDADGMPLPDVEAEAVTAAVRALPDDSPELEAAYGA